MYVSQVNSNLFVNKPSMAWEPEPTKNILYSEPASRKSTQKISGMEKYKTEKNVVESALRQSNQSEITKQGLVKIKSNPI